NMLGALRADPEAPIHIEALRQAAPGGLAAGILREFPPAPHNGRAPFAGGTRAPLRESRSQNALKLSVPKTCTLYFLLGSTPQRVPDVWLANATATTFAGPPK